MDKEQISPSVYFDYIKNSKNTITTESLKNSFGYIMSLAEKYEKTGQTESMKKLCFITDTLTKEEKLIEMGINTFIYKDVIEDYIENVADKTVKIIELSRYMREIPDELVDTIEKTKHIFDEMYVLFTDYTGKEERKVEKERRDKDPILFGVFKNNTTVSDRFYFLGDWVDEYCDITLDKVIDQYKEKKKAEPTITSEFPQTSEELATLIRSYIPDEKNNISYTVAESVSVSPYIINSNPPKKSFFDKVRSVFKK